MRRLVFVSLCLAALLPTFSSSAAPLGSRELDAVPLHLVSHDVLERARAALPPPTTRGPARLAIPVALPLGLDDGAWSVDGDVAIWRVRVQSIGATLLTATFDRFELPDGAALRFSDAEGTTVQGPYTAANRADDGRMQTALVPGGEALIELRVPASQRDALDLHLARIGHGVLALRDGGVTAKSGSCNVDALCETDPGWRDQIRSVVLLQIDDSVCTGNLVNTTAQDDRPYVLTASHCGATQANASRIVAYFNFQTSRCGGVPDGRLTQNISGAQLLLSHVRSDHTLIRLSRIPPTNYFAYFAGFNASSSAIPQNGRGIHHPSGDEKRISTYSTPASKASIMLAGNAVDAFNVTWSTGVTEPGSSGSGLWNQDKRLVGVLSGGDAACAGPSGVGGAAGPDYYGRLHVAWSAGLREWLDPVSSDQISIGGRNQGGAPSSGTELGGNLASDDDSDGGGGGAFGGALLLLAVALARRIRFSARS